MRTDECWCCDVRNRLLSGHSKTIVLSHHGVGPIGPKNQSNRKDLSYAKAQKASLYFVASEQAIHHLDDLHSADCGVYRVCSRLRGPRSQFVEQTHSTSRSRWSWRSSGRQADAGNHACYEPTRGRPGVTSNSDSTTHGVACFAFSRAAQRTSAQRVPSRRTASRLHASQRTLRAADQQT